MSDKPYRPRLVVEISEEQRLALTKYFPHGYMRPFFSRVIDDVLRMTEKGGQKALAAIIAGVISPHEVLPSLAEIQKEIEENKDGEST